MHLPLPADHRDPHWHDFCELARTNNHELIGNDGWDRSDESIFEQAKAAKADKHFRLERFLAYDGDVAVGKALLRVNLRDSPELGEVDVYVHPEHRGRGVGTMLAEELRAIVDTSDLERLEAWLATPPPDGGPTISPRSGIGALPADAPGTRFALKYGMKLGQVERTSYYRLDDPPVDPAQLLTEARAAAGPDYELIQWEGPSPEHLQDGLAELKARMTTDVPTGDLVVNEAKWDAARLRELEDWYLKVNRMWRTAVIHVPSGRVVAINELVQGVDRPKALLEQNDTVVLPEHRGHRLGMLVKAANIVAAREAAPDAPGIVTWNAEENRHMLAVNKTLGFETILAEGAFQMELPKR